MLALISFPLKNSRQTFCRSSEHFLCSSLLILCPLSFKSICSLYSQLHIFNSASADIPQGQRQQELTWFQTILWGTSPLCGFYPVLDIHLLFLIPCPMDLKFQHQTWRPHTHRDYLTSSLNCVGLLPLTIP